MNYFIVFVLALLPSFVWLLFYLRRDVHPEPNRAVLRIFFWSVLATLLATLVIGGFQLLLELQTVRETLEIIKKGFWPQLFLSSGIFIFLNAFWEEFLKFFVVKAKAINRPEFDEPVDAMEYMIIAGLGFAAVENLLISFGSILDKGGGIAEITQRLLPLIFIRFIGATLLHALASAIVGYFLAQAIFWRHDRRRYPLKMSFVWVGLLIATGLHGSFNFLIIKGEDFFSRSQLYIIALLLGGAALWVTNGIRKLNYQSLKKS